MKTLGPEYLGQQAYDWGDAVPCCGCALMPGKPADETCACSCHDTPRQFYRLEPRREP
jgi:hypothetical protein